MERVNKGEPANLFEYSEGDPNKQVLQGDFVEALLWGKVFYPKVRPPRTRIEVRGATIMGGANLDDLDIGHEVIVACCDFRGTLSGRNTVWRKGLTLDGTAFQQVDLEGAKFGNALLVRNGKFHAAASFRGAKCESGVDLSGSDFLDPSAGVDCTSMTVTGGALFRNVRVAGPVSFNRSKVTGTIDFTKAEFQQHPNLLGMEYGGIAADYGASGWAGVVGLLDWAVYDRDVYARLETHLSALGNAEEANKVYIAYKKRERREKLHCFRALWSYILHHLVGYGRKPWWVVGWSLVPLAVGTGVFRPKWMTPKLRASGHHRLKYNACWYSLDLFIPVINLHMKGDWIPRAISPWWLRAYMVFHIVVGWALVTVGLLALTGFIK